MRGCFLRWHIWRGVVHILDDKLHSREQLLALLEDTADDRVTRFVWLRQFEPGSNSSSANRLLDGSNICDVSIFPKTCRPVFLLTV